MRLKDKVAIVVGAGQTPGDTIGNGRATSILFAREGARVVLVDSNVQHSRQCDHAGVDEHPDGYRGNIEGARDI